MALNELSLFSGQCHFSPEKKAATADFAQVARIRNAILVAQIIRHFLWGFLLFLYSASTIIHVLRYDNGGEYASAEFEQLLLDQLIRHEYSNAREHYQFARAERGLPKKILPFAYAVYVLNRDISSLELSSKEDQCLSS